MIQGLVSVIMPTFNTGNCLCASIDSILSQTYQHLELLITDDGSTDCKTLQILKEYAEKDTRVSVEFLSANNGPGVARNNSIKRAQGHYIAFCDSDDCWMPDKLEKQLMLMKRKQCAMCNSSYFLCDEKDKILGVVKPPAKVTFTMQKYDNKIGCSTLIYDVKKIGKKIYMPTLRKRQDWAFTLTLLMECGTCYAIKEPLVYYHQRKNSVSSNKLSLVKYNVKVYESVLGFRRWKAYCYFIFLFLPSYFLKKVKSKWDSWCYLTSHVL